MIKTTRCPVRDDGRRHQRLQQQRRVHVAGRGERRAGEPGSPRPAVRQPANPSAGGATLVIWADEKRATAIKPLAATWATENGVTVKVESIATDIMTKFKTASQAGNPPDVVVWAHDVIGDFVQNSAIDPIQGLDTSGFDPLAVKGMTFDGQLYGVPYSVENIALIRNTDLAPDAPGDDGRPVSGRASSWSPTRRPPRSWPSRSARRATPTTSIRCSRPVAARSSA